MPQNRNAASVIRFECIVEAVIQQQYRQLELCKPPRRKTKTKRRLHRRACIALRSRACIALLGVMPILSNEIFTEVRAHTPLQSSELHIFRSLSHANKFIWIFFPLLLPTSQITYKHSTRWCVTIISPVSLYLPLTRCDNFFDFNATHRIPLLFCFNLFRWLCMVCWMAARKCQIDSAGNIAKKKKRNVSSATVWNKN